MLLQPLYKGVYRKDRRWVKGKAVRLPDDQVEEWRAPGLDPPLVDPAEWQRAQDVLLRLAKTRPQRSHPDDRPGVYGGFMRCGLCGSAMFIQTDSRGSAGYCCSGTHRKGCTTGQVSVRLADPQVDQQLEFMLGDEDTLRVLLERSLEDAAERAASPPGELARRIALLENQRARIGDAYVNGDFTLEEMRKRRAGVDGELAVLRDLLEAPPEAPDVDDALVAEVVDVFSRWVDLTRAEKRRLLHDYGMKLQVLRPECGHLRVERLELASLDHACIYKKMKRYGIE